MPDLVTLRTARTLLRPWRPKDRAAFAALNSDPVVMEHFPATLTPDESAAFADAIETAFDARGWGLWAVEVPGQIEFAGFVGLNSPRFEIPVALSELPPLEIGWRMARSTWGLGLATEAASAALDFSFDRLGRSEIVSFTTTGNDRSRRVMEKLGLHTGPGDAFDHPRMVELGHLRQAAHVLYRIDDATHRDQRDDPARRTLVDHIGRYNLGVRTGDWSTMLRRLTDDAQFTVTGADGAEVVHLRGRDRIGAACLDAPPTTEIVALDTFRDLDQVGAGWSEAASPGRRCGELRLTVTRRGVERCDVRFR